MFIIFIIFMSVLCILHRNRLSPPTSYNIQLDAYPGWLLCEMARLLKFRQFCAEVASEKRVVVIKRLPGYRLKNLDRYSGSFKKMTALNAALNRQAFSDELRRKHVQSSSGVQRGMRTTWVQILGGYRGYSSSKNLSEAVKYCISPQKMTKQPPSHKIAPPTSNSDLHPWRTIDVKNVDPKNKKR